MIAIEHVTRGFANKEGQKTAPQQSRLAPTAPPQGGGGFSDFEDDILFNRIGRGLTFNSI